MSQLFKIFRLGTKEAEQILSFPEEPYIHDFEELIVVINDELKHFIDFKSERFTKHNYYKK